MEKNLDRQLQTIATYLCVFIADDTYSFRRFLAAKRALRLIDEQFSPSAHYSIDARFRALVTDVVIEASNEAFIGRAATKHASLDGLLGVSSHTL